MHCSLTLAGWWFAGTLQAATSGATLLVVGDSLSAEYGLVRGAGWVALLEQRLGREKIDAKVVNASISGDTTSGGRARLAALLARHRPSHVVAKAEGAALVPFLLAGVADAPDAEKLFQPDRIHPTAAAHPTMLANVWKVLRPWLK